MLVIEIPERLVCWQFPQLRWVVGLALHFQEEREFECVDFVAVAEAFAAVDLVDFAVAEQLINSKFCKQEKKSLQLLWAKAMQLL